MGPCSLEQGITTIYSVVTYTRKTVGNVLGRMVFNYQNNPLTGSAELVDLVAGEEYIVSVAQYTSNWSVYESDTITVTGPYSSPNPPELRSEDIATINDLTSITLKTYFSDDYFNGGSDLTKMAFTVSSDTRIYNYIFDVTSDNIYTLTGLDGDKSYEINVCAINNVGISSVSNTIVENTSGYPSAPRNFLIDTDYISETDTTRVTLYWRAPNNANLTDLSGYVIKYKLSSDINFTEVNISSNLSENMSYDFSNVFTNPGETYEFKIMSYNSLEIGLRNNHTELKNAYIFKSSLPVQNVISVPGNTILAIYWDSPSDTRGYEIYNYSIKYYTGSVANNDSLVNTINSNENSITLTDLNNGQEYCIVIAAQTMNTAKETVIYGEIFTVTDVGETVRTIPFTNPSIPTDVSIIPSNSQISLEWSPPLNDGGFAISNYIINYGLSGQQHDIIDIGNVSSYTIFGLTNGYAYDLSLCAISYAVPTLFSINEGVPYEEFNVKPFNTSSAVQSLEVVPGDTVLNVSWVEPVNTGGFPIDHYKIYVNESSDYVSTESTSILLSGLTNGTAYTVTVVPYTMPDYLDGEVLMGETTTSSNYYPYSTSGPVRELSATPSDETIDLNWEAPLDTGGFLVNYYEISYTGGSIISTNNTSYSVSVNNGEDIEFTVRAVTININNSEELIGASSSVTSRAYTNPSPITNLQVTPEDSSIRVAFSLSINSGGYDIIQYNISRKLNGANANTYVSTLVDVEDIVSFGDDTFGVILGSLVNGTSYDIKVEVISDTPFGNNNTSSAETSENHIPYRASTGVRNIVVTPYNQSLNVEWDEPQDNGGFSVTEYDIYLNGVIHTTINASSRNLFIPSLTNGVYYLVSIIPVTYPDHISPSPLYGPEVEASNSVKPYTTPDSVDTLNVDISDKSLYLYWTAPSNTGGNDIVNYEVVILHSGTELLREIINSSTFDFTFNVGNVPSITNGTTYTLKCRAITQTDASELLYSSYQTITGKPFGKPIEIEYSINPDTDTITVLMNNNGAHISGVLICAPVSANATAIELANILVQNTSENPIVFTSDPLIDMFTITMNYDIVSKEQQPILIVATNAAGMYYTENFSAVNQVV